MRALVLALLAAGCGTSPSAPSPSASGSPAETTPVDTVEAPLPDAFEDAADYGRQREATRARLDAAVGEARASDVAACRVVPTSEQACGGPTTFAVYSSEDGDPDAVERLAERLVALDVLANRQFEYASTCMAYTAPEPVLADGRCAEPE